jgi:signal transduction histidine kinase
VQSSAITPRADASAAEFPLTITDMPIDAAQRRLALGVMIAVSLIELAAAPFAYMAVAHIDSFIPVLQSVIAVLHLITAVLLYSQYSIRPRFAILAIASGYVFSGLFAFGQTLAFPKAYAAGGLIGNVDTATWLFVVWQTTFALAVIAYALTKDGKDVFPSTKSTAVDISIAVACVVAAVGGLTWLVLIGPAYLPKVFLADGQERIAVIYDLNIYLWLLNSTALALLFFRRRTILDLWLIVSLFAWWPLFLVPMYFTVVRFSIGWYVGRSLAMLASSVLLAVLMSEATLLYARLASSVGLLRRERAERLASVEAATSAMAHEIRQPLAGIASMGAACLNWLQARPANIERARECVTAMVDASHHAEETISGIGGLFKRVPSERTALQLNEVCREVVKLVQHDILTNAIYVRARCQEDLPLIKADHAQIHQVILNLIRNAIDAMSGCPAGKRRLRLRTRFDGQSITLCVRDSGPGISDDDRERIFEPFYTTKVNGMGLGLAICRKIIEEHGGALRLADTSSHGSKFEIVLPVSGHLLGSAKSPLP